MRYTELVLIALAIATPAGAQQQPTLSLRHALELAREHSPDLPVAAGRVRVAEGTARERSVSPNPILELRQENLSGTPASDRFATLAIPLDLSRQRSALRAAGRESVSAALADSATTLREVETRVATLYWGAALADALAASAAQEEAALGEVLAYETTRLGEGAVAEAVVLRARLEAERARLATARAKVAAERAHAELARVIGVSPAGLPRPTLVSAPPRAELPSLEQALERAVNARPEMQAARRRVEAARWGSTAALRGSLPDVGLQLGGMQVPGGRAAIVALSFEVPVRNTGAASRERARGELSLAEAELSAVRRTVEAEVASALNTYQQLLAAELPEKASLTEQGAELAAIAAMAYREGALTLIELLDTQRAQAAARVAAATRAAELAVAGIELARALGAPFEESL